MNIERVIFGFFIVMALALNLAFIVGDIDNPEHHNAYILYAAFFVNVIATILKLGERAEIGALMLAASIVADILLIAAVIIWCVTVYALEASLEPAIITSIVSLAAGALVANIISVALLIIEATTRRV